MGEWFCHLDVWNPTNNGYIHIGWQHGEYLFEINAFNLNDKRRFLLFMNQSMFYGRSSPSPSTIGLRIIHLHTSD